MAGPTRAPTPFHLLLAATLACAALAGCSDSDSDTQETDMSAETAAFHADLQAWRDQRREALLAPDGWASLIGLHWIERGPHYLGSDTDNGIQLGLGPEHMGMIELGPDGVRFVPEEAVALTVDGAPLTGATMLRTDEDPQGPSVLGFDEGRGQATVIRRGGRHALRVRHADAATRTGFSGLDYWPADPDWQVEATFIPHPPGQTIEVANIIGSTDATPNPGAYEFERDGTTYRIEALDEGGDELFLVFGDRTNGHGSYGAGRFLYAPKPGADGRAVLDFNRSYNPPCAFTMFATCPLPPLENRLDLAITAGEKAYTRKE
ncbi:DUF1684 domain-containing protein [Novilysobacter arseniciresistens]|uniref:DUF1684 domain-containing protein n=1 Tax=Novilysobacter arseniciresistens TaxID=1385522 RepID=UPI000AEF1481|nr:DUF1684 domain-containing protein [Lysobacter arseniciresistens]